MTKEEKETIITWTMSDLTKANVYTCQPGIWRKLERLGFKATIEHEQKGRIMAKDFVIPRNYVKIGKPRKGRSFIRKALTRQVFEGKNQGDDQNH